MNITRVSNCSRISLISFLSSLLPLSGSIAIFTSPLLHPSSSSSSSSSSLEHLELSAKFCCFLVVPGCQALQGERDQARKREHERKTSGNIRSVGADEEDISPVSTSLSLELIDVSDIGRRLPSDSSSPVHLTKQ